MMTAQPIANLSPNVSDLRRARRDLVDYPTWLRASGRHIDIRIINISLGGLMCRCDCELERGEQVMIALPGFQSVEAEVRWSEDGRIGVEFLTPMDEAEYNPMLDCLPRKTNGW